MIRPPPELATALAGLPPIGGHLDGVPEHFVVDEIPLYEPSGEGTHWYVRVRKRRIGTPQVRRLLAEAANVNPRDVGVAGRKDFDAVTTQTFSLPAEPVDPEDDRIELLECARHGNKLRMGHLLGNRFTIRLREVHADTAARLPALVEVLERGIPNYFGEQRFGPDDRNLTQALGLLRNPRRRVRDPRFLASAFQSHVFNAWLTARVADGLLHTTLLGDVLRKRETGGLFDCTEPEVDQPRMDAGEVDPTGPLPGPKMRATDHDAASRESDAFERCELDAAAMKTLSRFGSGTRRVARLVPGDLELTPDGADLLAAFTLPKGAYATVVLGELARPDGPLRRPQSRET